MIVVVLNCGSSTVKFQVFEMQGERTLATGLVDRIGMAEATLSYAPAGRPAHRESPDVLDHGQAVEQILSILTDRHRDGVLEDRSQIGAIGHRVVHGGESFTQSALITDQVLASIRECVDLAPLHNPPNLKGITACARVLPGVPQVAVFDTAFHQTMPERSYLYALPYVLYKRHRIRRYGFHGTSHSYVYHRFLSVTGAEPKRGLRVVTCHLGNGCSVAAIQDGKVVDTSMGMTPLEGLVMGTRCGDLDPALILHVMGKEELTPAQATTLMNKHSGLYGLSGVSSDMREVLQEATNGNRMAALAVDVFCYRLRKYVGAYAAALGGLDGLVFTGGIGCNAAHVRARACEGLEFLGLALDTTLNDLAPGDLETRVSSGQVEAWVIPTNEELVIARDTARLVVPTVAA